MEGKFGGSKNRKENSRIRGISVVGEEIEDVGYSFGEAFLVEANRLVGATDWMLDTNRLY